MLVNQLVLVNTIMSVGALGLLLLCLVLLIECIAALLPLNEGSTEESLDIKVGILVPAHNEAAVIGSTLMSIKPQLLPSHRLVVVADNCSDETAKIARSMGATVIERYNAEQRGKGYALDFGLRFMSADPPDVLVLIDADCRVEPGAIAQLSQKAITTQRPVQATYLMAPAKFSPKQLVSAFAFKIKNQVRLQGLSRLGQPCLLTGTGMAFPWSVICNIDLAHGHIVEDMKLGLDLCIAGHPPIFCPQANVTGYLPQEGQTATTQRTRWEHGHLKILLSYVPMLIKQAWVQKRLDLFVSALDMCVPPLSLLVAIWLGLMGLSVWVALIGISSTPAIILLSAFGCLLVAIGGAWAKFAREDIPLVELLKVPVYILWKIPLYLKFAFKPETAWISTKRD